MKITIATGPIFPVPAVRGGAVQRLWEGLAREFVKRGHAVTIFARKFPGQRDEEMVDGIRYVRRGGYEQSTSIKRDLVQCLLYALKTARHVPPGDVVVTNDFWMPAVLPWLKPSAGKIVVNANRFPKKQYWLYSKCAAFAAVSAPVAVALKAQTPSAASKVAVVPNSIADAFLEPITPMIARDKLRILYVGRIHPEKGLGLLVQALKGIRHTADGRRHEVKGTRHTAKGVSTREETGDRGQAAGSRRQETEWECVLVGPVKEGEGGGGEAFAEELKRKVEGLPVRFDAPVYDPADLAKIYDEADVFVYPSVAETGEAMPLAPVEAMARGVVPVVSDLAVFRDYLQPGVNGMVFNHRSQDAAGNLAAVLRELLGDADRRERMGTAARETAERFSPSAIADKYLQLFKKVVSGA